LSKTVSRERYDHYFLQDISQPQSEIFQLQFKTSKDIQQQPFAKTCATCPFYQSHQDGTDKGWCGLFNAFARENHAITQDCINTIADEQAVAQAELNEYIEVQAEAIAPEQQPAVAALDAIEVDSDFDPDFGIMTCFLFNPTFRTSFCNMLGLQILG